MNIRFFLAVALCLIIIELKGQNIPKFGISTSSDTRQSENHFILGLVDLGKGDRELANEQFEKSAELNQNHVWAKTFLNLMKQNVFYPETIELTIQTGVKKLFHIEI